MQFSEAEERNNKTEVLQRMNNDKHKRKSPQVY